MSGLTDQFEEALKYDLKEQELLQDIKLNNDVGEIEDSLEEALEGLLPNIDDPKRKLNVYVIMVRWGKLFGSDKILYYGKEKVDEWKQQYGDQVEGDVVR